MRIYPPIIYLHNLRIEPPLCRKVNLIQAIMEQMVQHQPKARQQVETLQILGTLHLITEYLCVVGEVFSKFLI